MEPLRPLVDRLVLDFVQSHTFTPSDFVLRDDGVCRLHPQLAREAAARLARDDRVMREVVDRGYADFSSPIPGRAGPLPGAPTGSGTGWGLGERGNSERRGKGERSPAAICQDRRGAAGGVGPPASPDLWA